MKMRQQLMPGPEGGMTLAKLDPTLGKLTYKPRVTSQGVRAIRRFGLPECAVIRVPDGRHMLDTLSSHHYMLMSGASSG